MFISQCKYFATLNISKTLRRTRLEHVRDALLGDVRVVVGEHHVVVGVAVGGYVPEWKGWKGWKG